MNIRIDTSQIVTETERLTLRSFVESDLEDLFAYASVPGVGEMAGWPHHQSIETSKDILTRFIEKKDVFALFHKTANKVIGSLGLHEPPPWATQDERFKHMNIFKIGYVLSKDFWGKGLMPEAVKAVIDYGFDTLGIDAFTCEHFTQNNQSRRVIEKIGFKFVTKGTYHAKLLDKTFDEMRYILVR
jgi:ribosomal-protein-alanine N-acetyltransferase